MARWRFWKLGGLCAFVFIEILGALQVGRMDIVGDVLLADV